MAANWRPRSLSLEATDASTISANAQAAVPGQSEELLTFRLTVTDNKGVTGEDSVQVRVRDINNQAPIMTSENTAFINEGTNVLIKADGSPFQLTASDEDTTGEQTIFIILPEHGQTLFSLPPATPGINIADYEAKPCGTDDICNVLVTPTDGSNIGEQQLVRVIVRDFPD